MELATMNDEDSLARADSFSQGTGKITGAEKAALKEVEKRVRELQAKGEFPKEARDKTYKEMRDNPRKDWRRG
jgi:hypothetical protein